MSKRSPVIFRGRYMNHCKFPITNDILKYILKCITHMSSWHGGLAILFLLCRGHWKHYGLYSVLMISDVKSDRLQAHTKPTNALSLSLQILLLVLEMRFISQIITIIIMMLKTRSVKSCNEPINLFKSESWTLKEMTEISMISLHAGWSSDTNLLCNDILMMII